MQVIRRIAKITCNRELYDGEEELFNFMVKDGIEFSNIAENLGKDFTYVPATLEIRP